MSKQIKFKAWNTKEKIMAEVGDLNWTGKVHVSYKVGEEKLGYFFGGNNVGTDWEKSECKLLQFTGREDAEINGKEVWEGDIIENCDTKLLQVVYWDENKAAWYCRYVNDEKRLVSLWESLGNLNKVVGNIYENSELVGDVL